MNQENQNLFGIARALAAMMLHLDAESNLQAALRIVVDYAVKLISAEGGGIYLYDPVQQTLEISATTGFLAPNIGDGLRQSEGLAASRAEPYRASSAAIPLHSHQWLGPDTGTPATVAAAVPMFHNRELVGVIALNRSDSARQFTEADVELLNFFAAQAINVVTNSRLRYEVRHHRLELEGVTRISNALRSAQTADEMLPGILDETLGILEAPAGLLWLHDPGRAEKFKAVARGWLAKFLEAPIQPHDGITEQVLETGEAYVVHEFVADPRLSDSARSYAPAGWGGACLPIWAAQETMGVLFVSIKLPRVLRVSEMRFLGVLVELAGNAIHRTRLLDQTRRRAEQMAVINRIGQAFAETLDLGAIYERLALAVHELLPDISTVFISLFDSVSKLITCTYALHDGESLEVSDFPPVPLEPPGIGTQSRVVHTRSSFIANDLHAQTRQVKTKVEIGSSGPVVQSGMYVPMLAEGRVVGVMVVQSYTLNRFSPADAELLGIAGNAAAVAIQNAQLFADLEKSNAELALAYDATIEGWSRALDLRDRETEGHTQRVTTMTLRLARMMEVGEPELVHIQRGALLHDIGKMGVPDNILLKPGPLTDDEWLLMRQHPEHAYNMLEPIAYLAPALDIPYCHHEKWDGTGYPRKLKGEQIPLAARIFAVVDVWDALRSDRPYRKGLPDDQVFEHIRQRAGTHFDPQVVDVFLKMLKVS